MKKIKRILFAAGGTGGHLFPAIALSQEISISNPEIETLFLITDGKMEKEVMEYYGLNFEVGISQKIKNIRKLFCVKDLIWTLMNCMNYVRSFKPDLIE